VLVVEDEMLIAVTIEEALQDLGCIVVGPVGRLEAALQMAGAERLDVAILDFSIRGGLVFPVAETLRARGIPFVFASGYGDWVLPDPFAAQPRLTKPFTLRQLEAAVRLMVETQVETC
jgi:DNA-binding response OmpR family regulator